MKNKYKLGLALIGIAIAISLFVAQSYALWIYHGQQTNTNTVSSGCFSVGFTEGSSIHLTNAYPMSDASGLSLVPYTFTITNTCTVNVAYTITLNTLSTNTMEDSKMKFALHNGVEAKPTVGVNLGTFGSTPANINTDTANLGVTNLLKSYKLESGLLNGGTLTESNTVTGGESKTYHLYLWIDETAGNEVMDKTFEASINVNHVATTRQNS